VIFLCIPFVLRELHFVRILPYIVVLSVSMSMKSLLDRVISIAHSSTSRYLLEADKPLYALLLAIEVSRRYNAYFYDDQCRPNEIRLLCEICLTFTDNVIFCNSTLQFHRTHFLHK